MIHAEVERRRAHGIDADEHPDVLSALLVGADDEKLTDAEVLDQVRSLIAARLRHDVGCGRVGRPRARAEPRRPRRRPGRGGGGDRRPSAHARRPAAAAHGRRRRARGPAPVAPGLRRRPRVGRRLRGRRARGARRLDRALQRLRDRSPPELWPDADRFDPSRWAPGRPDPPRYAFVPFGGGARRCIGFALATLELQVLVTRLARRARWRLEKPDASRPGSPAPSRRAACPSPFSDVGPRRQRGSTGMVNAGCSAPPSISMILPGHPRGRVAGQVDDAGRDVLDLADPAHRRVRPRAAGGPCRR